MKKCSCCNVTRPLSDYTSNGYSKKGTKLYKPFCKFCRKVIYKNYLRDEIIIVRGNPVAVPSKTRIQKNEYMKRYREKNREILKEKAKEHYPKYYEENREKILKRQSIARKLRLEKQRLDLINKKRQGL